MFHKKKYVDDFMLTPLCSAKAPPQPVLPIYPLRPLLRIPHRCHHHHRVPPHMWVSSQVWLCLPAFKRLSRFGLTEKKKGKNTDCAWHVFVFFQFAKVVSWSTFLSATGVPRAALWFTSPNRSTTSGQSNGSECLLNPPQWVLVEYGPFKILYINIFTSNVRKPWH